MDSVLRQQARDVLELLSRARSVFGGDHPPDDPPAFVPARDLEHRLTKPDPI